MKDGMKEKSTGGGGEEDSNTLTTTTSHVDSDEGDGSSSSLAVFEVSTASFSKRDSTNILNESRSCVLSPFSSSSVRALEKLGNKKFQISLRHSAIAPDQAYAKELFGRDEEIATLHECLKRLLEEKENQTILISGEAGVGKSALASILKDPVEAAGGAYACGKANLFLRDEEPLAVLAGACEQFFSTLQSRAASSTESQSALARVAGKLSTNLDKGELHTLASLIPSLKRLIQGIDQTSNTTNTKEDPDPFFTKMTTHNKSRFVYTFQKLIQACTAGLAAPLVLVLEDLHWADADTFQVLQALLVGARDEDPCVQNLMIVVSYRSSEASTKDFDHSLSTMIRELREKEKQREVPLASALADADSPSTWESKLTEIKLGNLSVDAVNQVVMRTLNVDDEKKTRSLTEIVHQRTHGNTFFLLSFLELLQSMDLLTYNMSTMTWIWDVSQIAEKTAATANVVGLIKGKMKQSAGAMSRLLPILACLGSDFNEDVLLLLSSKLQPFFDDLFDDNLLAEEATIDHQLIEKAIKESYLEPAVESNQGSVMDSFNPQPKSYRFVHDQVREAAQSLLPHDKFNALLIQLAKTLLVELNENNLSDNIFVVANMLNKSDASTCEQILTAKVNLKAAKRAKEVSAFASSANFAAKGVAQLPGTCWTTQYSLALELCSLGAQVESFTGNVTKSQEYCSTVLNVNNMPILDKLQVYRVQIDRMVSGGQAKQAMNMALAILSELDCKFPKKAIPRAAMKVSLMRKCRDALKDISLETLAKLPLVTDTKILAAMRFMLRTACLSVHASDFTIFWLASTRLMLWTLKFGLSDVTPCCIAFLVFRITHMDGDFKQGQLMAELAIQSTDMCSKKLGKHLYHTGEVLFITHGMVYSWCNPIVRSSHNLLEAYKMALLAGDTEVASLSVLHWVENQLVGGKSLNVLTLDLGVYFPQVDALKRDDPSFVLLACWQTIDNLIGRSANTTVLTGARMNNAEAKSKINLSENKWVEAYVLFQEQFLCVHFGDHAKGAKLAIKRRDSMAKMLPGVTAVSFDPFLQGLSLYARTRTTRNPWLKLKASNAHKKLQWHVRNGNPNVVHALKLLDAENEALHSRTPKRYEQACACYREAVAFAARGGFQQDAGLASERYADFLLETDKDHGSGNRGEAIDRLQDAIRYYSEWGANGKVGLLEEKLGEVKKHH